MITIGQTTTNRVPDAQIYIPVSLECCKQSFPNLGMGGLPTATFSNLLLARVLGSRRHRCAAAAAVPKMRRQQTCRKQTCCPNSLACLYRPYNIVLSRYILVRPTRSRQSDHVTASSPHHCHSPRITALTHDSIHQFQECHEPLITLLLSTRHCTLRWLLCDLVSIKFSGIWNPILISVTL